MNFIISCGGTGGHLSPGIAIAERLTARGHYCTLIISSKQVDARLVQKYADTFEFVTTPGKPFSQHPLKLLRFAWELVLSVLLSFRLIRQKRPDAVIAFGGFITPGICVAAYINERPIIFHEANRVTGRAIRYLRALADRIYLPPGKSLAGVSPQVLRNAGFPVRLSIEKISREAAREQIGMPVDGKLLLIQGGSQGASNLNNWVTENSQELAAEGINVFCLTGLGKGEDSIQSIKGRHGSHTILRTMAFTDDMASLLCAADLVIARAGAGSIAEMVECNTPSILVPYPYAADNHQLENARFLERHGGCVIVEESRLDNMLDEVRDLLFNDWMLQKIQSNLENMADLQCAERIAIDIENIASAKPNSNPQPIDLPA